MPRAKRSIEAAVTIDGFSLIWHLHREQQFSEEDGWRGLSIHVKVAEGVRRELHLEYPAWSRKRKASNTLSRPGPMFRRPGWQPTSGKP